MELIIIIPALILLGVLLYQQMGNLLIKTNSESYDRILESTGRILDNNLEYYRDISRIFFLMIRCRRYWKAIKPMSRKMG